MKRHTITLGATTTAGGEVISASSAGDIHGKRIALKGDVIFCKRCKGEGHIVCIGPRIPETWNGRQVALENDLCACRCMPPPRLLPAQFLRYQSISDDTAATAVSSEFTRVTHIPAAGVAGTIDKDDEIIEQYFSLLDEFDRPLADYRYDILRDGVLHAGASKFEDGKTGAVAGEGRLGLVLWHSRDGATRND
jgi:uncharacterized Zn-binding protein involved in type VI secretion